MARGGNLDARTVEAAKPRDVAYRLSDGGGLLLVVKPTRYGQSASPRAATAGTCSGLADQRGRAARQVRLVAELSCRRLDSVIHDRMPR